MKTWTTATVTHTGWTMGRLQAAYRAFVVDLSTGFSRGIGATQ